MKVQIFALALCFSCLEACVYDPPTPYIEIENESGTQVELELYFDKENYKAYWSKSKFQAFLTYPYGYSRPGPETKLIFTNTKEFVQRYAMPARSVFVIPGDLGEENRTVLYKKITVIKAGRPVSYNNIDAMKRSFKRMDKYSYKLVVK